MTRRRRPKGRQAVAEAQIRPAIPTVAQWADKPVWALLGYASEADYDVLAAAVDCHGCGRPLPRFHRYRVRQPFDDNPGAYLNKYRRDRAWAEWNTGEHDLCVCSACKALVDMGGALVRQETSEILQGRLFT